MLKKYKKYGRVFNIGIRNSLEYRFDFFTSLLFGTLPIFVSFYLWNKIYFAAEVTLTNSIPYNLNHIITYIIIIQFIGMILSGPEGSMMTEIKSGGLSKYLIKPINYFVYNIILDFASKIINILPIAICFVGVGFIFNKYIILFNDIILIVPLFISIVFAYLIRYFVGLLLGMVAFWLTETSSLYVMTSRIIAFLSGVYFPLFLIPGVLYKIIMFSPLSYIVYFPAMITIGEMHGQSLVNGLLISGTWVLILLIATITTWKIGLKRYESFGG
jgi:ABC-2 type transport system permease protein